MGMEGMSDEELALLTEEERAGLAEDQDGDEADGNDDNDGDDGADDDGHADDGDKAGGEGADNAEAAPGAEGADGAEGRDDTSAGEADDDDHDMPAPQPAADRIDAQQTQARLDAITTEKAELMEKLDDGEITTKEFTASVDKLNDEKNALSNALTQQVAADKAIEERWYQDVNRFLEKNPDLKANDTRLQSFDAVVRRVTGDPANASLTNKKQLEIAHATWRSEMGLPDPAKQEPKAQGKPAGKKPAAPKAELPPTLHNVPAADIEVGDDGKYSYLDALLNAGKSIEYEDALAKLSEADQQDYLSRA